MAMMIRSRWLIIITALLTILYTLGLIADWPYWIHGDNWVWFRAVPLFHAERFALLLGFIALQVGLVVWVQGKPSLPKGATAVLLLWAICAVPLFQLAIAKQSRTQPFSVAFLSTIRFFQEGVTMDDPATFIHNHLAAMPTYRDVHLRTQPPGWLVAFWGARQVWSHFPSIADPLAHWLRRDDCLSYDLQGYNSAQIAAATLQMSILFWSGLLVLPLYGLGRDLWHKRAGLTAVLLLPFMPALSVFQARFDVFYALVALTALWLTHMALRRPQNWLAPLALAVLLAGMTFLSFGVLAIILLINAFALAFMLIERKGVVAWLRLNALLGISIALLWGAFWLAWGASWPAMFQLSQAIHRELRINYPLWSLFNLYDMGVFMGLPLMVGGVTAVALSLRAVWHKQATSSDILPLGWGLAVLALNASGQIRAETGRLWLFLLVPGLLVGVAYWLHHRRAFWLILCLFCLQATTTAYLLSSRREATSVPEPSMVLPSEIIPLNYQLGTAVALRGYTLTQQGEAMNLTLYWQALANPQGDYSVFAHQLQDGQTIAQSDSAPQGGALPTWCWISGEVVADGHTFPATAVPYQFVIGLYDWRTGERLPVSPPVPDNAIPLAPVP